MEATSPRYVSDSVRWRCLNCSREMKKCYNNIKFKKNVCPCRWQTLTKDDYHQLADRLDILWLGVTLPQNTKSRTSWAGCGKTFVASYTELGYGIIPQRLREFIPEKTHATTSSSASA